MIKNKLVKGTLTVTAFTVLFLLLSFFHQTFIEGGGFLISSPTIYGRGYPLPYFVWDISKWPEGVTGSLTLEQLAYDYPANRTFLLSRSVTGLIIDTLF